MSGPGDCEEVPRGCTCSRCFQSKICVCNKCRCQHQQVGSEYVCPDKKHLYLERKRGKGAMSISIANRVPIRLESRVLRFGEGGSFTDELERMKKLVAQQAQENEELRRENEELRRENEELRRENEELRIKAGVVAKAAGTDM